MKFLKKHVSYIIKPNFLNESTEFTIEMKRQNLSPDEYEHEPCKKFSIQQFSSNEAAV